MRFVLHSLGFAFEFGVSLIKKAVRQIRWIAPAESFRKRIRLITADQKGHL
jgi:hypothetical protein